MNNDNWNDTWKIKKWYESSSETEERSEEHSVTGIVSNDVYLNFEFLCDKTIFEI